MSKSVSAIKKSLAAMPAAQRDAAETQMLADYSRHAAFNRPLGSAGVSSLFSVTAGLEEAALEQDADIVSVTTAYELQEAIEKRDAPLLLVPAHAQLSEALICHMLERSLHAKTVFISSARSQK